MNRLHASSEPAQKSPSFVPKLRSNIVDWSYKYGTHPYSGFFIGLYAFAATVIETIPVALVLSIFVVINRSRTKQFVFLSVLGSSLGAATLAWLFHRWGYSLLADYYPTLIGSNEWKQIETWVTDFGMFAVAGVAAVPFPLTPAIALCGLMRMPVYLLFVSVIFGKTVKYSCTALIARQSWSAAKKFTIQKVI